VRPEAVYRDHGTDVEEQRSCVSEPPWGLSHAEISLGNATTRKVVQLPQSVSVDGILTFVVQGRRPSEVLRERADAVKSRLALDDITNVRVFGSIVRSEDTPESDIDLLVDMPDKPLGFAFARAWRDVSEILGFDVDLVASRAVPERKQHIFAEAIPI